MLRTGLRSRTECNQPDRQARFASELAIEVAFFNPILSGFWGPRRGGRDGGNGKARKRTQLSDEERWWKLFWRSSRGSSRRPTLQGKWGVAGEGGVEVSVIVRLRALAKDAAVAAFAVKPSPPASVEQVEQVELELLCSDNDWLSEAL